MPELPRPGLKTIDPGTINVKLPKPIPMGKEKQGQAGDDFLGALSKMQAQAAAATPLGAAGGLRVAITGIRVGIADTLGLAKSNEEKLIDEAREHLLAGRYQPAIALLDQALSIHPGHHDALYLKAYCQHALDQLEAALRTLLPLRGDATVKNRLATQISQLRAQIRGRLCDVVLMEFFMLMESRQLDRAQARIKELLVLSSDAWFLYYFLAGNHLMLGRLPDALAVLNQGLASCPAGDCGQLEETRRHVLGKLAREKLIPVRTQFKHGKYSAALATLRQLAPEHRTSSLGASLEKYLDVLVKSSRKPAQTPPKGTSVEVDELYWFLAEEEIVLWKALAAEGRFAEAEAPARTAQAFVPGYPYVNWLRALAMYNRLGQAFESAQPPPLEQAISELRQAQQFAKLALVDPEIEAAPRLLEELEKIIEMLQKVQQQLEKQKQEAKPVNDALQEFDAIFASVKDGISSSEQLEDVYRRLSALKSKVDGLTKKVISKQGQEVVKDLQKAIVSHLKQLDDLRPGIVEANKVKAVWDRFERRMKELERHGPLRNPHEATTLGNDLRTIRSDAQRERKSLKNREAQQAVDKLIGIIDGLLKQLP